MRSLHAFAAVFAAPAAQWRQGGATLRSRPFSRDDTGHLLSPTSVGQYQHMTKRIIFGISILIVACLTPACGGEDTVTQSGGEFFAELFEADCEAIAACGFIDPSEIEFCTNLETNAACELDFRVCATEYSVPSGEWADCVDATRNRDCSSVEAGLLPTECTSIEELF